MSDGRINYLQPWATDTAERLRQLWRDGPQAMETGTLFDPDLVFHLQNQDILGPAAYLDFVQRVRSAGEALDLVPELVLGHEDKVLLIHRWRSDRWHADIVGGGSHSAFCKMVLRLRRGRVVEIWQQQPDYLFLLGKQAVRSPMIYPEVLLHRHLRAEPGAVVPADDDAGTRALAQLFVRMNDCFMNRASLREMAQIQQPDIRFLIGGSLGSGVASWKTFAYALHTCLQGQHGTRLDDLYLRDGDDTMRVYLRAYPEHPAPTILACGNGVMASMRLRAVDGRIQDLWTHTENYIQFLDTDFTRHGERLRLLFQGRPEPVSDVVAAPAASAAGANPPAPQRRAVAIVGIAGRWPGCEDLAALWQALEQGRSLVGALPPARAYLSQGTDIRHAAFLEDVTGFDPGFFQMLPAEAQFIDPQQRLLLQEVVHAIEDSGHPLADFAGDRTGVFVSSLSEDYRKLLQESGLVQHPQTWAGNESAMFPAKLARFLDARGACQFVNAECASALVGLHQAAQAIAEGRIDQAVVGATSLLLHSYGFAVRREALLTAEPAARLFSRDSRGQLRGEAVVAVVLKSLDHALADGDRIHALVAGSAVNNSGRTLSLVAGSVEQQARAMLNAWRDAGVPAGGVDLIECHSSGVRGGDFAEIASVRLALKESGRADAGAPACVLATAKAATGHAEAASGLTGLAKVLLQLRHGRIVPIHGLGEVDPALPIDPALMALADAERRWLAPTSGRPRRAGINAFAAGGYNAHLVIEEWCGPAATSAARDGADAGVVTISAQSEASLRRRLADLDGYLAAHPATPLAALTAALQRQDAMKHRAAFVVPDLPALRACLAAVCAGDPLPPQALFGRRRAGAPSPCVDEDPLRRAQAWVQGAPVSWRSAVPAARLFDLPAYPFDTRPLWLPVGAAAAPASATPAAAADAPLWQETASSSGRRWTCRVPADRPWLAQHRVGGQAVLPGVVSLELVRAAMASSLPDGEPPAAWRMAQVAWVQPIVAAAGTDALALVLNAMPLAGAPQGEDWWSFELATEAEGTRRLHCQGQVHRLQQAPAATPLADLAAGFEPGPGAATLYERYRAIGIDYGPYYRAIDGLRCRGSGATRQVLARLCRPEAAPPWHGSALHPALADAALHSALALLDPQAGEPAPTRPPLPFAVASLELLRPLPEVVQAWIRHSPDADPQAAVQRLDIDLLDDQGHPCVRWRGFASRRGDERAELRAAPADSSALAEAMLAVLAHDVALKLQIPAAEVELDEPLNEFGFDSISLTEFGNRLNEELQLPAQRPLNPTVFFEHPTLRGLAGYLARSYPQELAVRLGHGGEPPLAAATPEPSPAPQAVHDDAAAPGAPGAVAIIGISGRFPMAEDLDAFWQALRDGRDCISEVPAERWDWRALFGSPASEPFKTDVKWGGFIDGVAEFDPLFFGISPREAELMDPQQRLLMQHAWAAIEDAGHNPRSLAGSRTGVFLGTAASGYTGLLASAGLPVEGSTITGMVPSVGPHRISYLLDLHGPSEPIETACSSSLVAVHRALGALADGQCDLALAGGVNTIVTPDGHIGFRKAGMICTDGRCKTFSRDANGYVRGEGVGVVLLKPLQAALRDRDVIHGVILGSAENHGGRANSFTAPNPRAQSELLKTAWQRAGVDPTSISYIEAHGTGTELGDPIEVNGIRTAFEEWRQTRGAAAGPGRCGLGSVKSNIGHLELAAGVAGLLKVLAQMRHRTLVASLHCEELNPYLALDDGPLYVVRRNQPWTPQRDAQGREQPLRAGVSAFGFGGANAHVVLESHPGPAPTPAQPGAAVAIVLSARTRTQLGQVVARLRKALDAAPHSGLPLADPDLPDLAYTLQCGREPMDERLAVVVSSVQALRERLDAVLNDRPEDGVVRASLRSHRTELAAWRRDPTRLDALRSALRTRDLQALAEAWVVGLPVDWDQLYDEPARPRRISLPTYPFAREHCWVPTPAHALSPTPPQAPGSTPTPTRDSAWSQRIQLDGREPFLADHQVDGQRLLPAVACLEMARAAYARCAPGGGRPLQLRDVVWPRPVRVDPSAAPVELRLDLLQGDDGGMRFALLPASGEGSPHCQGRLAWLAAAAPPQLDLADLRARCAQPQDVPTLYRAFERIGLVYGPTHRGMAALSLSAQQPDMLLARLDLPPALSATLPEMALPPGLLDAALQTAMAWQCNGPDNAAAATLQLPFHLSEVVVHGACRWPAWVWLRRQRRDDGHWQLDLDLCDEAGRVALTMRGFALRERPVPRPGAEASTETVHTLEPRWLPMVLPEAAAAVAGQTWVVGHGPAAKAIAQAFPAARLAADVQALPADLSTIGRLVWVLPDEPALAPHDEALLAAQAEGVMAQFRTLQRLLQSGAAARTVDWTVLTTQASQAGAVVDARHAACHGLAGTLAKEMPLWRVRVLDLPLGWSASPDHPAWRAAVAGLQARASAAGETWAWREPIGGWAHCRLAPATSAPGSAGSPYRHGGVYVVIGGAGGIGEAWSEHLLREHRAQIVWIGRRPLDHAIQARIDRLSALGPAPRYLQADATQRDALQAACDAVRAELGRIDGVVHSAVALHDASLLRMDEASFSAALSAKLGIALRMAQVFEAQALDLVLFFSSLVSFARPAGQANYVAGCVAADALAGQWAQQGPARVRVMHWGYWGGTGVGAHDALRRRMASLGMGSIEPGSAMPALESLLSSASVQRVLVSLTRPLQVLARGAYADILAPGQAPVQVPVATPAAVALPGTGETIEARLRQRLREMLGESLKVPPQDIDSSDALTQYGLDSITGVQLAQSLNQWLGVDLDVTLFFDHPTIDALSRHLVDTQCAAVTAALAPAPAGPAAPHADGSGDGALGARLEQRLAQLLSQALKVPQDEIDPLEPFSGYGLDSITGVQLAQSLGQVLDAAVDVTVFLDHGHLRALAAHLLAQHGPAVRAALDPETAAGVPASPAPAMAPQALPAVAEPSSPASEAIAIVGLSAAFPGAADPEALWAQIVGGHSAITEVPAQRWNWRDVAGDPAAEVDPGCFRWGAFLPDVDAFDHEFFGIDAEEARYLAPQQRLLLTHAWQAVEDAGLDPSTLSSRPTGVFMATVPSEYLNLATEAREVPLMVLGLATSMVPNRISQVLNLHGPSEHIDTACSSTLVALHRAVRAIRAGECEQALVGAVNLMLTPSSYIGFESMGYLSQAPEMAAFGPKAQGFVRAEAVGALLLMPLSQALAGGHPIRALIRGTGVAHGGSAVSMTTPNGQGMREAIRQAHAAAGWRPDMVDYVEAHGIANALGDAIELSALKSEFPAAPDARPCRLGTSKALLGYAEVASGLVSLVKVLMALRHGVMPGVPGFEGLHGQLSLRGSRLELGAQSVPWPMGTGADAQPQPRRAAIHNFGFSGVNACLLLEEAPVRAQSPSTGRPCLVPLSARSASRLRQTMRTLAQAVERDPDIRLEALARTLQVGRQPQEFRAAFVVQGTAELAALLQQVAQSHRNGQAPEAACLGRASRRARDTEAAAVSSALASSDLAALARLWVRGAVLPWDRLSGGQQRLSLPGSALVPRRCWIDGATGLAPIHTRRPRRRSSSSGTRSRTPTPL